MLLACVLLSLSNVHTFAKQWYVIYSKTYKEQQAQFHLARKGIESFFPRLHLPCSIEGARRIVPLFPNYLFVCLDLSTESHYVIWTPGVKRFVSFSDAPLPLEESVIRFLQENADDDGIIAARSQLQRGQPVEISAGPFMGLAAIIQDPPDARGRVNVLLKLMSRHITVKLGVEVLKGQGAACGLPASGNIGLNSFLAVRQ
ncbi:MAG: transcription termination/antitermination protein NusG [Candidatus Binatia bacterium]